MFLVKKLIKRRRRVNAIEHIVIEDLIANIKVIDQKTC